MAPKLDRFHNYRKGIRYNFIPIPMILIYDEAYRSMSADAKILYSLILNRMRLSERNHWEDEQGVFVKYSTQEICEDLQCSDRSALKYRKELVDYGLIDVQVLGQGKESKIYPYDFAEPISELEEINPVSIDSDPTFSDASFDESIEAMESVTDENTDEKTEISQNDRSCDFDNGAVDFDQTTKYTENADRKKISYLDRKNFPIKNGKNFRSRTEKSSDLERKNFPPEKEYLEKDNNIYNPSINPPNQKNQKDESIDRWTEQDFEKRIRENLAIDTMQERTDWPDLDQYLELYRLMIDSCRTKKPTIRIGGQECPVEKVRERFLELNYSHLLYVIDAMKKNTTEIRNIRSYLLTALYRSPETKTNFYQAWVNHDFSSPEQPRAKNPHGNPSPSYTDDELADLERKLLQ